MSKNSCSLCGSLSIEFYCEDKVRQYFKCNHCYLVFVSPMYFLSEIEENNRYDKHENVLINKGYVKHLSRIVIPLESFNLKGKNGLDFGCGENTVLVNILENEGYNMDYYDFFYFSKKGHLEKKYDFVTITEVVEHFSKPGKELNMLWSQINPKGVIAIMTKMHDENIDFKNWYYKNDLTHICFFSKKTFIWLAEFWKAGIQFFDEDIVFFKK